MTTINGVLTIYHSKRDVYGNVYYAIELGEVWGETYARGTISADNVSTVDCRENLKWIVNRQELPIRQFNKLTKGWPYLGCRWEDIKDALAKQKGTV